MKHYDKLLFVSSDDTATAPMAEALAQELFALEDILVESRGLVVLFPEPVNPKAEAILKSHGLTMKDHQSKPFDRHDFDDRTLVIAIDRQVKEKLLSDYPDGANVWALCDYIGIEEDVERPYGGELADYGHCFERLEHLVEELADRLKKQEDE